MELYVRSDSVVSRVIAGETLIVPISKGVGDLASIYSLNPVASAIWDALTSPTTHDEIVARIMREFECEREQVHCDVQSFLTELESAGLVKLAGVPAQV